MGWGAELAEFTLVQAGQVKHECNRFQMWHRSPVRGVSPCVCVCVSEMNAPESTHFLYKFRLLPRPPPPHSSVPWITSEGASCSDRMRHILVPDTVCGGGVGVCGGGGGVTCRWIEDVKNVDTFSLI